MLMVGGASVRTVTCTAALIVSWPAESTARAWNVMNGTFDGAGTRNANGGFWRTTGKCVAGVPRSPSSSTSSITEVMATSSTGSIDTSTK